jgi:outer membrane protein TolC
MDTLHELALARQKQDEAVRQQNKAYRISLARYREGLDNALTLAVTQQNQLAAERVLSQIQGNQFLSSVGLIKALGGGWQGL